MTPVENRLDLMGRIVGQPRELRDNVLHLMREDFPYSAMSARQLLADLSQRFYRPLDDLPGLRGRDLCLAWWQRGVVPVIRELDSGVGRDG